MGDTGDARKPDESLNPAGKSGHTPSSWVAAFRVLAGSATDGCRQLSRARGRWADGEGFRWDVSGCLQEQTR